MPQPPLEDSTRCPEGGDCGKCLIFIHIPKTAGTSFSRLIQRLYPSEEVSPCLFFPEDIARFEASGMNEKKRLCFVMGHFYYGIHQSLPHKNFFYFTILRKPAERVVSFYYHILRDPDHWLHETLVKQKLGLNGFVRELAFSELDNLQVRMLSSCKAPFGEVSREDLETAKRRLRDSLFCFGLTERYDESLLLMKEAFGMKFRTYTRENVGRNKPLRREIPPEIMREIERMNALDIELYDFAREIFDKRIREKGIFFKVRCLAMVSQNRILRLVKYGLDVWRHWRKRRKYLGRKNREKGAPGKLAVFFAGGIFLTQVSAVWACPMCADLAERAKDALGTFRYREGLLASSLLLISMPFAIAGAIIFYLWKKRRRSGKPHEPS